MTTMNKYGKIILAASCALAFASCQPGDKINPGREVLVISGIERGALVSFGVEEAPETYSLVVNSTRVVSKDTKVKLSLDNSLVEKYNSENNMGFKALPEGDVTLSTNEVTITAGKASSDVCEVKLNTLAHFEEGATYVIPVTITGNDADMEVLEAERTIYLKVARTIMHSSIDINNSSFSSNFVFSDDLKVDLDNYTFEIKIFPYSWNGMTPSLSRLCAFENKDEKGSLLYRFGEKVSDATLQVKTPSGELITNTEYDLNRWTMISVVYNGTNIAIFNDGVKDVDNASTGEAVEFQRVELGMSWTSYASAQLFHGRVAEIRVWNRALTSSEMKSGLCGVPANAEGLIAYWKFDEASGSIFKDATGHGYDMDWSKSCREVSDGGGLVPQDKSAYINRIKDEKNKCTN